MSAATAAAGGAGLRSATRVNFDPGLHPRDREGRFLAVLGGLSAGQRARLPGHVTVERGDSGFRVHTGVLRHRDVATVGEAARVALAAHDARVGRPGAPQDGAPGAPLTANYGAAESPAAWDAITRKVESMDSLKGVPYDSLAQAIHDLEPSDDPRHARARQRLVGEAQRRAEADTVGARLDAERARRRRRGLPVVPLRADMGYAALAEAPWDEARHRRLHGKFAATIGALSPGQGAHLGHGVHVLRRRNGTVVVGLNHSNPGRRDEEAVAANAEHAAAIAAHAARHKTLKGAPSAPGTSRSKHVMRIAAAALDERPDGRLRLTLPGRPPVEVATRADADRLAEAALGRPPVWKAELHPRSRLGRWVESHLAEVNRMQAPSVAGDYSPPRHARIPSVSRELPKRIDSPALGGQHVPHSPGRPEPRLLAWERAARRSWASLPSADEIAARAGRGETVELPGGVRVHPHAAPSGAGAPFGSGFIVDHPGGDDPAVVRDTARDAAANALAHARLHLALGAGMRRDDATLLVAQADREGRPTAPASPGRPGAPSAALRFLEDQARAGSVSAPTARNVARDLSDSELEAAAVSHRDNPMIAAAVSDEMRRRADASPAPAFNPALGVPTGLETPGPHDLPERTPASPGRPDDERARLRAEFSALPPYAEGDREAPPDSPQGRAFARRKELYERLRALGEPGFKPPKKKPEPAADRPGAGDLGRVPPSVLASYGSAKNLTSLRRAAKRMSLVELTLEDGSTVHGDVVGVGGSRDAPVAILEDADANEVRVPVRRVRKVHVVE